MKIINNIYYSLKNQYLKKTIGEKNYKNYRKNISKYIEVLVWSDKKDLENKDIEEGITELAKKRIDIEKKIISLTNKKTLNQVRNQFESLKVKYLLDDQSIKNIEHKEHYDILNSIGAIIHTKIIACESMPNEIF